MIHLALQEKLQQAVLALLPDTDISSVLVRPCPEPKFGDYQTNALIGLAKRNELNPREFAAHVVEQLDIDDCCEPVEIAGILSCGESPNRIMAPLPNWRSI